MKNNLRNFNAPSTRSVLAFLFLPEFKRSFPAFAHIGPVFVRTIAMMFVQAGLLRPNHPAMMAGMARDVPKYKFSDLLGEAWYNLRTGDGATPYQYGAFISVIMMIGLTVMSAFMFVMSFFMSAAQAQLFSHPYEDTSTVEATAGGSSFFQSTQTHPDLAIDLLNKVLRQSAYDVGKPMQNALGALMEIYNTALLVIASIVVFWAIISIIVDTARTGQIGGGRHSIVWVPIRFVFALALMIPLLNGFNGGQMAVMKIAEWGSNLGTNAWYAYVKSLQDESLIGATAPAHGGALAISYAYMEACRSLYNNEQFKASGGYDNLGASLEGAWEGLQNGASQAVGGSGAAMGESSGLIPGFWNNTGTNRFVKYRTGSTDNYIATNRNKPILYREYSQPFDKEINYNVGTMVNPTLCGTIAIGNPNNLSTSDNFGFSPEKSSISGHEFTRKGQLIARTAHKNGFEAMIDEGQKFGCHYASHYGTRSNGQELFCESNIDVGQSFEGQGAPSVQYINNMAYAYEAAVADGLETSLAELRQYVTSPSFLEYVEMRGWAGMGAWYHTIQRLNSVLDNFKAPTVYIRSGSIAAIAQANNQEAQNKEKEVDKLIQDSATALGRFGEWWQEASLSAGPDTRTGTGEPARPSPAMIEAQKGGQSLDTLESSDVAGEIIKGIFTENGQDLFLTYDGTDGKYYPMTELVQTGNSILAVGMAGYAAVAVVSGVAAFGKMAKGPGLSIFSDVADVILGGPIGDLISTALMLMILSGMVLKFYVPILPWIRVAFSVLSWLVSVFEAVIVMPILALMNLSTEGDGLFTQGARNMWVLSLNLLLRPILTVIGFVASLLLFNAMVLYVNDTFQLAINTEANGGAWAPLSYVVNSLIYVFVIFTLANTTFKTVDTMPAAVMRWMNAPGDNDFQDSAIEGFVMAAGQHSSRLASGLNQGASGRAGSSGQSLAQRLRGGDDSGGAGGKG